MYIGQSFLLSAAIILVTRQSIQGKSTGKSMNGRKVVLMSMDGFRYDYLNKTHTPNFDAMIKSGVKVPYVNNTFATLTFPCHYSIATGRYEESHGIIGNSMYDPKFDAIFKMSTKETKWWDGAEPIWLNAVKSGLQVGTFFWPGSEVEMQGHFPSEWRSQPYDSNVPFDHRVNTLISDWLVKEDVDFGIIYFNEPDHSGHAYGPEAPEMVDVIQRMDNLLGYFIKQLEKENIKDKVDFILTSDHGMTTVDQKNKLIDLSEHLNETLLKRVVSDGPLAHLIPQDGKTEELVAVLSGIDHLTVYLKEDIPDYYHYKNHRRVMPIVVLADLGWEVRRQPPHYSLKGNHGYSNLYQEMKPIFIATGPSFKNGAEAEVIQNVDIYPLICHLLGIEPAPNNGSTARWQSLLASNEPGKRNQATPTTQISLHVTLITFILTYAIVQL